MWNDRTALQRNECARMSRTIKPTTTLMTRQLKYASEDLQIELSISYSRRRTLSIKLKPDDPHLYVNAPVGMRDSDILSFVGRKSGWIN